MPREEVTFIRPTRGIRLPAWRELWAHRGLLWVFAMRDVKVRYKETALGCAWALIQPVMGMAVFSIIFGRWAKLPSEGYPYPIFVYAALLPWTFFSNAAAAAAGSVLNSGHLITKVYFPRLVVPMASLVVGLLDFAVAMGVMFLLMLYYGVGGGAGLLALPLLVAAAALAALGIGTFLAALVTAYRDFRFVVPFLLQLWMYATPVVYPASLVPEKLRWIVELNPMTGVVEGFRSAFLGRPFQIHSLGVSLGVSILLFLGGVVYFGQVERRFADIL